MTRVLAIDVGTSAVKAAIVDAGRIEAVAEAPVRLSMPHPGWAEQDPDDWWRATVDATRAVTGGTLSSTVPIDVIGLTGQMQDLIPLDADGRPVRPALLYSDTRATAEHAQLVDQLGEPWRVAAGAVPDATTVAAKWRWLDAHEPDTADRTAVVLLGGHSVVAHRMTGRAVCDPSTAATTGLYDLATASWWGPVVAATGIVLPELVAATEVMGTLGTVPAHDLGLPAGLPVVHANGDAVATTVGVVGRVVGRPYAYLGTSGWVAVGVASLDDAADVVVLPGLDPTHWVAAAPMPTAGAALDWARRELVSTPEPAGLDDLIADRCAAAEGVLFLPHLDGARFPHDAPDATGVLVGVRRSTDRATVAAAVVEGVAHAIRQLLELVAPDTDELVVCGGAARSSGLRRALADVTGRRTIHVAADHATVLGAAIAASVARGEPAGEPVAIGEPLSPDPVRHARHRRTVSSFDDLLPTLSPLLTRLVEIRSSGGAARSVPADRPGA